MADTIFYHNAFDFVKKEIKNREAVYGKRVRAGLLDNTDHNSFLGSKTAFARVRAVDKDGKTLKNAKGNDIQIGYLANFFESTYDTSDPDNIVPNAVLNSVNVRHDGEYGTLQRATVTFKTFSISQLEFYEQYLLVVGQDIEIDYGWSVSGTSNEANKGTFKGITYNFSYQLDKDGGFNCTFDCVGEGYYTLGIDPNQANSVESSKEDALGELQFKVGIMSLIDKKVIEHQTDPNRLVHGTVYKEIATFQNAFVTAASGENANSTNGTAPFRYYITLRGLVDIINNEIINLLTDATTNKIFKNVKFICNSETTIGYYDPLIKSTHIKDILLPGNQANYDPEYFIKYVPAGNTNHRQEVEKLLNIRKEQLKNSQTKVPQNTLHNYMIGAANGDTADYSNNLEGDGLVDLSLILISVEKIQEIQDNLIKNGESNINSFFSHIFSLITTSTGGNTISPYDLTLYFDVSSDVKDVRIINKKYVPTPDKIEPIIFKPFGTRSVVRDISLSAQIPTDLATEAYVAGRSTTKYPPGVKNMLTNKTQNDDVDKVQKILDDRAETRSVYKGLATSYFIISHDTEPEKHYETANSTLSSYVSWVDRDCQKWNHNILLPLKLSVTIDGISGFKFGDTIGTNYLPKKYVDPKGGFRAVFTVTKVNHEISGQNWTTTLETVCRLGVE